jgi:hypothetical protein
MVDSIIIFCFGGFGQGGQMIDHVQIAWQGRDRKKVSFKNMEVETFKTLKLFRVPDESEYFDAHARQRFDQMAADKTRSARDERFHCA